MGTALDCRSQQVLRRTLYTEVRRRPRAFPRSTDMAVRPVERFGPRSAERRRIQPGRQSDVAIRSVLQLHRRPADIGRECHDPGETVQFRDDGGAHRARPGPRRACIAISPASRPSVSACARTRRGRRPRVRHLDRAREGRAGLPGRASSTPSSHGRPTKGLDHRRTEARRRTAPSHPGSPGRTGARGGWRVRRDGSPR